MGGGILAGNSGWDVAPGLGITSVDDCAEWQQNLQVQSRAPHQADSHASGSHQLARSKEARKLLELVGESREKNLDSRSIFAYKPIPTALLDM